MEQQKWKVGDRVKLSSGGPVMTVLAYDAPPDVQVACQWFDGTKFQSARFHPDTLVSADDPAAPANADGGS